MIGATTEELCFLCSPYRVLVNEMRLTACSYKRLKLGGGQVYDRSSDSMSVVAIATNNRA
jgi:hypothetical protein